MLFDFNDPATVTRLVGLVVPLLVALVTKKVAKRELKTVLNILFSALAASIAYLASADGHYDFGGFVNAFLNTFVVSVVSYYGAFKPAGVTEAIAEATKHIGLGVAPRSKLGGAATGTTVDDPNASSVQEGM